MLASTDNSAPAYPKSKPWLVGDGYRHCLAMVGLSLLRCLRSIGAVASSELCAIVLQVCVVALRQRRLSCVWHHGWETPVTIAMRLALAKRHLATYETKCVSKTAHNRLEQVCYDLET